MKKLLMIACASLFVIGCNSKTESTESTATTGDTTKIDYAYLPENHAPDNWIPGSQQNLAFVLKSLKAFETGDIEGSLAAFADSVHWSFDGFDQKISKDSMRAMMTGLWKTLSSVKITMADYETVTSKDNKEEWVTLWYKQVMTDKAGGRSN
jgi:hypothetical protein